MQLSARPHDCIWYIATASHPVDTGASSSRGHIQTDICQMLADYVYLRHYMPADHAVLSGTRCTTVDFALKMRNVCLKEQHLVMKS